MSQMQHGDSGCVGVIVLRFSHQSGRESIQGGLSRVLLKPQPPLIYFICLLPFSGGFKSLGR